MGHGVWWSTLEVPSALAQAVNLHREFMCQCRCWLPLVPLIRMAERQQLAQERLRPLPTVDGLWSRFFVHVLQAMQVHLKFQPKIGKSECLYSLPQSVALMPERVRLGVRGAV